MMTLDEVKQMKKRVLDAQLQEPRIVRRRLLQQVYNSLADLYADMLTNQDA